MEGTRKRGRARKRLRDEDEEGLNIMRMKTRRKGPETVRNGGRLYLRPVSTMCCSASGGGGLRI